MSHRSRWAYRPVWENIKSTEEVMIAKFRLFMLMAGLLGFSMLSLPADLRAEAPTAPVFEPMAKLVSGNVDSPAGKFIATDGNKYYMALLTADDGGDRKQIKVVRIPNDGSAPELTGTAVTSPPGQLGNELAVAVSDTSSGGGTKKVHLLWSEQGNDQPGLYYSWSNDSKLSEWSPPLRINGKSSRFTSFSIVVDKKGNRHVIFIGDGPKIYHAKAAEADTKFSEPAELPGNPLFGSGGADIAIDQGGALHIAFMATTEATYETEKVGLQYTALLPEAGKWSPPVEMIPLTDIATRGEISIAAFDSRTVFVASTLVEKKSLDVYSSGNGGAGWTKETLATGRAHHGPSIAVAPDKSVMAGSGFLTKNWESQEARIFRSADGSTWSPAKIIPGHTSVSIVLDGKGKAAVFTVPGSNTDLRYISKEK